MAGTRIVAPIPREVSTGRRLIPSGAIADQIIVRDGDDIVRLDFRPLARPGEVQPGTVADGVVDPVRPTAARSSAPVGCGRRMPRLDEWRVLTAAALAGLVEQTMTIARERSPRPVATPWVCRSRRCRRSPTRWPTWRRGCRRLQPVPAGRLVPGQRTRRTTELAGCAFVFMARKPPGPRRWRCTSRAARRLGRGGRHRAIWIRARGWPGRRATRHHRARHVAEIVETRSRCRVGRNTMDFSTVELSTEDRAFRTRPGASSPKQVTDEVIRTTARPGTISTKASTRCSARPAT